jgi:hypothetical protein
MLMAPLVGSAGCAALRANPQPTNVLLDTPLPPPRVITPIESEPIGPILPPVEAPATPPVETPARRPAPRPAAPRAEKVDPAPASPVVSVPAPAEEPPPALQTTANAGETEQRIRTLLTSAARDLSRIDYRTLSVNAQAQYDIAKRFREQSEEALKAKNLVFAEQLADKAAALAGQLLKR